MSLSICVALLASGCASASSEPDPIDSTEEAQVGDVYSVVDIVASSYPEGTSGFAAVQKKTRDRCVHTKVGPGECYWESCGAPLPHAKSPTPVDLGRITVSGGRSPIALVADAVTHEYPSFDLPEQYWKGGEHLTISAAGNAAGIHGFVTHVIAPEPVTLTAPAIPPDGQTLTVDRGKAFEVTWTGGHHGLVALEMYDRTTGGPASTATCYFDPRAHHGALPAALVAMFPAGPAPDANHERAFDVAVVSANTVRKFARHISGTLYLTQINTFNDTENAADVSFK